MQELKYFGNILCAYICIKRKNICQVLLSLSNISVVKQDDFTYDPETDENDKLEWVAIQKISREKKIDYADSLILQSLKHLIS